MRRSGRGEGPADPGRGCGGSAHGDRGGATAQRGRDRGTARRVTPVGRMNPRRGGTARDQGRQDRVRSRAPEGGDDGAGAWGS